MVAQLLRFASLLPFDWLRGAWKSKHTEWRRAALKFSVVGSFLNCVHRQIVLNAEVMSKQRSNILIRTTQDVNLLHRCQTYWILRGVCGGVDCQCQWVKIAGACHLWWNCAQTQRKTWYEAKVFSEDVGRSERENTATNKASLTALKVQVDSVFEMST